MPGQNHRPRDARPPPATAMPATLGWGHGQLVPMPACAPQQGKEHHKLILMDGPPGLNTPHTRTLVKKFYAIMYLWYVIYE